MTNYTNLMRVIPRRLALFSLASAIAITVWSQNSQPTTNDSQPTASQATSSQDTSMTAQQQPSPTAEKPLAPQKEGFWGRVNPFARKKWVKKQIDPINDRLSELDEVNAKNARDIKDVDARAQAGIQKAQSAADAANQLAMNANTEAQNASSTAHQASGHVDQLNTTVNGLDQYHQITDVDIRFRQGTAVLTSDSKEKLDQLASSLTGREGYIVEMEAHSPGAGSLGIQSSERLAEAVKRYLVTEHQIPIYRMHAVALGNQLAMNSGDQDQNQKPGRIKNSTVHVRLMENSLAAPAGSSPQSAPAAAGAEQP